MVTAGSNSIAININIKEKVDKKSEMGHKL